MGCGFELRKKQILAELQRVQELKVAEIVDLTGAAIATIRRDLLKLEEMNLIVRTFGSIRPVAQKSLVARTFEQRSESFRREKQRIAARAAQLVTPGMTVVIDSGTTCWNLASCLKEKAPLRIITSALAVIETLGGVPEIEINLVGGRFRVGNLDFFGPVSVDNFRQFHADIAFLSCDGFLPGAGAFSGDAESAAICRAIRKCADRCIMLCDSGKIGKGESFLALSPESIDGIITDREVAEITDFAGQVIIAAE